MYSGTILNFKDIQIELFKYAGQFCIIQEGIPNQYTDPIGVAQDQCF